MKKIITSLMLITLTLGFVGAGTVAYFSDTETSTDNTFVAGSIDLMVGNDSYYNGIYNPDTSWPIGNLTTELYFNFLDVKPGDWGNDTISLRVEDNPSWVCANVTLTSAAENDAQEPETSDGDDTSNGTWDGELDEALNFFFYADANGSNSYDVGESILMSGPVSGLPQGDLNTGETYSVVDSGYNAFGEVPGTPFPAYLDTPANTRFIGKAWCFGALTPDLVGGGYTCDGSAVNNVSQSDDVIGNVAFYAVQQRHNEQFTCDQWNPNVVN